MTRFTTLTTRLAGLVLAITTCFVQAQDFSIGDIGIAHPYAVVTPPGATTGAGYVEALSNRGAADDRLIGVASPAADRVEVHAMSMDGNVMRMRQVPDLVIPAKGRVDMAPGDGYHLMLLGLTRPLKAGDRIPLTLSFAKAGKVDVEMRVEERRAR